MNRDTKDRILKAAKELRAAIEEAATQEGRRGQEERERMMEHAIYGNISLDRLPEYIEGFNESWPAKYPSEWTWRWTKSKRGADGKRGTK